MTLPCAFGPLKTTAFLFETIYLGLCHLLSISAIVALVALSPCEKSREEEGKECHSSLLKLLSPLLLPAISYTARGKKSFQYQIWGSCPSPDKISQMALHCLHSGLGSELFANACVCHLCNSSAKNKAWCLYWFILPIKLLLIFLFLAHPRKDTSKIKMNMVEFDINKKISVF